MARWNQGYHWFDTVKIKARDSAGTHYQPTRGYSKNRTMLLPANVVGAKTWHAEV